MMIKIKKGSLHQEIARQIRKMVIEGNLKEGEKLNQAEICASLGVSLTPLRDALKVLNTEGLVRIIPNHGVYISKPEFDEIQQVFDVLCLVESYSVRIAVEKLKNDDILRFEAVHQKMEDAFRKSDIKNYQYQHDIFHESLWKLSENKPLQQVIQFLRQKILLFRAHAKFPMRLDSSLFEHRNILKAIQEKAPEKAEQAMKIHVKNQIKFMKTLLNSIPQNSDTQEKVP